jgi:UDP-3-O-[3-hydroxymyristoyl] glucosamine N-acyltransferase
MGYGVEIRKFYSTGDLADLLGATLQGDAGIQITGIGSLEDAGPGQLSFLTSAKYANLVPKCNASALIVPSAFKDLDFTLLICEQPYLAFARAAQLFAEPPFLAEGVHGTAHVEEGVDLGPDVFVGALAHIGSGCSIGGSTRVYGGAYIGRDVQVGRNCLIYPRVTILDGCIIGDRVIIHSGTVIGSDGFGFAQDDQGRHVKIPQMGIVCIDDDVEIGANCAIDRAAFGRTWIQRGTKIDNLVQIAHNVVVGEHSILIAQVGVSGSTRLGGHVVLAGQVGVVGHIEIGDGVRVGAKSGVRGSVKAGQEVTGSPALPHREFLKLQAHMRRLPEFRDELRQLRIKVKQLEEALHGD